MKDKPKMELTEGTSIQVEKKEYKGVKAVDLRKHVATQKYTGPTKSGLWIPVTKWEEFKELVNSIEV